MGRHIEHKKISGIYQIQSGIKPERIYIGSAVDIYKRWYYHKTRLRKNIGENGKLQNHFNKYGEGDLQFSILLGCPQEDLLKVEQYFIDSYNPWFNICKKAGSSQGRPPWNKGMKGEYHRTKGCFQKGNIPWTKGRTYKLTKPRKPMSEEQKEKIRQRMMGKKYALKKVA